MTSSNATNIANADVRRGKAGIGIGSVGARKDKIPAHNRPKNPAQAVGGLGDVDARRPAFGWPRTVA